MPKPATMTFEQAAALPQAGVLPYRGFAIKGRFSPFDLGPIRLCAITKVAQRPDHLVDATGVVTQNLALPLEPVGDHRMV